MSFPRQISIKRKQISRPYSFIPTFSWAESVSLTTTGVILILSNKYHEFSYYGRYQFQGESRSETCPLAKIEGINGPEIRNLRILIVNAMSPTAPLLPVRLSALWMMMMMMMMNGSGFTKRRQYKRRPKPSTNFALRMLALTNVTRRPSVTPATIQRSKPSNTSSITSGTRTTKLFSFTPTTSPRILYTRYINRQAESTNST